jgi:3-deoxy-D-manno-octulosonic acid kinase
MSDVLNNLFVKKIRSLKIISPKELLSEQYLEILASLDTPSIRNYNNLNGRGSVLSLNVSDWGEVVVKNYRRGGFYSKIIDRSYLRSSNIRSALEFKFLNQVRALGILAPEPLAYAYQGTLVYRAWLITRKVTSSTNLVDLSLHDQVRANRITYAAAEIMLKLIKNKIFHIDLHPGNILVDCAEQVYIIDFDKARYFSGGHVLLRDLYIRRWRRAVIKHNLPEALSEIVCLRLRTIN